MKLKLLYIALISLFGQVNFALGQELSFTRSELKRLWSGEMLTRDFPSDGPWPKYQVISYIDSSPGHAMAVFAAFSRQKDYVPGVLKSEVVQKGRDDKGSFVDVSYVLKTPWPVDNSVYTNRHYYQKHSNGELEMTWIQLSSNSTDSSKGGVRFLKRFQRTMMVYDSEIKPKSMFAGIFKNKAREDLENAIKEIKKFIESNSKSPSKNPNYEQEFLDYFSLKD